MSNFVDDLTSLPAGKVDGPGSSISVPAGQKVTAAEWNSVMQALVDTRGALLTGKVHGLEDNPSAGVGSATQSILRSRNGALEVSEGGADYSGVATVYTPRAFGAKGDGTTDDTTALQACFDAAAANQGAVAMDAGKTYKTTASLRLGTGAGSFVKLEGRGATLQCAAPCSAVLRVVDDVAWVRDLHIGAGREANYGLYYEGASTSRFDNITVYQPLIDGFHSETGSDRCHLTNCYARICGRIFHTAGYAAGAPAQLKTPVVGTVSKTAGGSCVVTRDSGTFNFNDMGVRQGDLISVHATAPGVAAAEWLQVDSVSVDGLSLNIDFHQLSSGAASGLQFSVHVGNAYHEGPGRAENNINRVDNFLGENCAGSAVRGWGLYGARYTNIQANGCFGFPVVIGSPTYQSIGTFFHGVYFEVCEPRGNFFFGGAAGVSVDTANVEAGSAPYVSASGFSWGTLVNFQNASDPGRVDPVDETTSCYWRSMVVGRDARLEGKLKSRGYLHYYSDGGGFLQMADNDAVAPWRAKAGLSWVDGPTVAGFDFDTDTPVVNGAAGVDLLTKHLSRWKNNGVFKAGVGFEGDYRTTSTDTSGTPGNATIDKPAGRVALAAGDTAVVVNCALCRASSHVFIAKQHNDVAALDFKVVPGNGAFTITSAVPAAAAVTFDFFIVNVST